MRSYWSYHNNEWKRFNKIITKKKQSHNFCEFFVLIKSLTNKSNAKAVCKCCIDQVGGLATAQVTQGCFTTNKARLCHAHLANCEAFKAKYMNKEVAEILSRSVPEDFHKNDGIY